MVTHTARLAPRVWRRRYNHDLVYRSGVWSIGSLRGLAVTPGASIAVSGNGERRARGRLVQGERLQWLAGLGGAAIFTAGCAPSDMLVQGMRVFMQHIPRWCRARFQAATCQLLEGASS
jgi:hypothetical protein